MNKVDVRKAPGNYISQRAAQSSNRVKCYYYAKKTILSKNTSGEKLLKENTHKTRKQLFLARNIEKPNLEKKIPKKTLLKLKNFQKLKWVSFDQI